MPEEFKDVVTRRIAVDAAKEVERRARMTKEFMEVLSRVSVDEKAEKLREEFGKALAKRYGTRSLWNPSRRR
ncbi:hypothetical protein [Thermococcus stetteri]|uniref:hypothetical protein n=1 Tax=Thermococcus stetteri TaxID=49900 RepID=UPI001AE2C7F8|nr:hypothetical protein [Thermococcus stetteri]MBP1910758.1 hypothetical protein [Thermococcus stetteri]